MCLFFLNNTVTVEMMIAVLFIYASTLLHPRMYASTHSTTQESAYSANASAYLPPGSMWPAILLGCCLKLRCSNYMFMVLFEIMVF